MNSLVPWEIRRPDYTLVDIIYYQRDCDEGYIRAAEGIPLHYLLRKHSHG